MNQLSVRILFLFALVLSLGRVCSGQTTVATPELRPTTGAFYTSTPIEISCQTAGAVIHYTLDGSAPDLSSPTVASGSTVAVGRALILKARAVLSGTWSEVASGTFSVTGQVAAGSDHALALHFEATKLWAWGGNASGQVGDGTTTDRSSPVRVLQDNTPSYLTGVIAAAAGNSFSLALREDKTLVAWGANGNGQLGDGTTSNRACPVALSLAGIENLAAGGEHALALDDAGQVWAWGKNSDGQVGTGNTTSPQSSPEEVLVDATTALADITRIAAGNSHSLALDSSGSVWAWGHNASGELGDGTTTSRSYATQSVVTGATHIAAGQDFSLAVKADGTLVAWGANGAGQLGHGVATTSEAAPVVVYRVNDVSESGDHALENVAMVAAGATHALALTNDGKVWAWGGNADGELGDGTTSARLKAVRVQSAGGGDLTNVVMIACGSNFSIALKADGSILTWGAPASGRLGNGQTSGSFLTAATHANLPQTSYQSPSVSLTLPLAGTYIAPATLTLKAGVAVIDGSPDALSFLINGVPLAGTLSTSSPPNFEYEAAWNNIGVGSYTVAARFFDNYGAATDSPNVQVTVVPPTVSITATTSQTAEGGATPAQFTVARNAGAPTTLALTISYTVAGSATPGSDYAALSGIVVIPATQMSATINVAALTDSIFETSETVTVTLSDGGNNYSVGTGVAAVVFTDSFPIATNVRLHLRADSGVTLDSGGKVSTWGDQSGLGNNATQSTSTIRPDKVTGAVNGMPVIRFNGTSQYFGLPNLMSGASAGELFVVLKAAEDTPATAKGFMNFGTNAADNYYASNDSFIYDDFGTSNRPLVGGPSQPLNQFHLYNASSKAGEWKARINGLHLYSTSTNTVSFTTTPRIGHGGSSAFFAGDIAEVVIFDRVLNESERIQIESYLGGKYALAPAVADPTTLAAVPLSPSQVSLTWISGLTNFPTTFLVERREAGGSFAPIATVQHAQHWMDTTAAPGTTYDYRVKASNWSGISGYSNVASASTPISGTTFPLDLKLWLKADCGTTEPVVSRWLDQSGFNNHAYRETVIYQPQLIANAVNGRPVVRFNGSSHALNLPNLMAGATEGELFVVLKAAADPAVSSSKGFMSFGTGSDSHYPNTNGEIYDGFGSTTQDLVANPLQSLNEFHLYNASSKSNDWNARINGQFYRRRTTNTVAFQTAPRIGLSSGSSAFFQGDMAEIMIYNRVLSPSERAVVETYLGGKYGLAPVPAAPTGLAIASVSPSQMSLSWNYSLGNTPAYFVIERRPVGGTFEQIALVANAQSWVDSTAMSGTAYEYRVKTRTWAGDSTYSSVVAITSAAEGDAMPLNPKLWLKADAGTQVPGIIRWMDQSGFGNSGYAATTNPVLISNALNGKPVVRFNGTTDCFLTPNFLGAATAGEIFIVLKAAADPPPSTHGFIKFGSVAWGNQYPDSSGTIFDDFGSTTNKVLGNPSQPLDTFHLYNASSQAADWSAAINEVLLYKTSTNTVGFAAAPRIGQSDIYNYFFKGDMAEVVIFDRVLSATERRGMGAYFNSKYQLTPSPASITGFHADVISPTQVALHWTKPAQAVPRFRLERKEGGGEFQLVAIIDGTKSFHLDSGCTAGMHYTYRICSSQMGLSSAFEEVQVTLPSGSLALPTSTLVKWFKADEGVVRSSTETIERWINSIYLGGDAVQTFDGHRPMWIDKQLNGRPVVRISRYNDYLSLPADATDFTSGCTVFLLAKPGAAGVGQRIIELGNGNTANRIALERNQATSTLRFEATNSTAPVSVLEAPGAIVENQWQVFEMVHSPTTAVLLKDGVVLDSDSGGTIPTLTRANNSIGRGPGSSDSFYSDIAEILVFNSALSESDRTKVREYLSGKYALGLAEVDTDEDGRGDWTEFFQGTNIIAPETEDDLDLDGILFWDELNLGTDPFDADTDNDGVSDGLDAFPLDPTRSTAPQDDTDPPVITLTNPALGPL